MSTSTLVSSEVVATPPATKPRMAYVVSLFPCWSETFIAEELQHLLKEGFEISIFSLKPASEKDIHRLSQSLIRYTIYPSSYWSLFSGLAYYAFTKPLAFFGCLCAIVAHSIHSASQFVRFLATFVIAVCYAREATKRGIVRVHAHWATFPATAAWIIRKLNGTPYSFTTHAHDLFLADSLLPQKIRDAQFVVTISDFNRQLLESMGADESKLHVIHCGVDTSLFQPTTPSASKDGAVLTVGRLAPIKGFEVLIDACAILKDRGIQFRCEIVGEGPLRSDLSAQIGRRDVSDCVKLSGFADQDQIRLKLQNALVFVLPSRETKAGDRDGIPVALMEAMAMQVPVVSTSVSGIPELVENDVSGVLVPPEDPTRLADALCELLENRSRRTSLAQAGRVKVLEQFDIARNASALGLLFVRHP